VAACQRLQPKAGRSLTKTHGYGKALVLPPAGIYPVVVRVGEYAPLLKWLDAIPGEYPEERIQAERRNG